MHALRQWQLLLGGRNEYGRVEGSDRSRHAQRSPLMFVSRVLRQPTRARTLHARLFASKPPSATTKAVPERSTAAGSPQTKGERKRAHD
jgi:hypothetical protein